MPRKRVALSVSTPRRSEDESSKNGRDTIFSHGMLYVALSQAGNWNSVYHLSTNRNSRNVVYNEVL